MLGSKFMLWPFIATFLVLSWPINAVQRLKFVVYFPQIAPYMYQHGENPKLIGVIPELLQQFFTDQRIVVEFVDDNRQGAEQRLYRGEVDAMLLTAEWAEQPQQLIFSAPVIQHQDFLYALQPVPPQQDLMNWLHGKSICTREYYRYRQLDSLFATNSSIRIDSSSEQSQLKMLQNGRCDAAYLNEHVADYLKRYQFQQLQLYRSEQPFEQVNLTIAFHPRWHDLIPKLNLFLLKQHQSGLLQQKLQQHIGEGADSMQPDKTKLIR